jgi:hypothetical protein
MATSEEWELPQALRPRQESLQFDLQTVYRSVVLLHTETSEDAYTASILGTDRLGHGVVIRSAGAQAGAHHRLSDHRGGIDLAHRL